MMTKPMVWIAAVILGALLPLCPQVRAEIREVTVNIDGMSCPFCAYGVEKKLKDVDGVEAVAVAMGEGTATLSAVEGGSIDVGAVPEAVERAGFTPGAIQLSAVGTVHPGEEERWSFRVRGTERSLRLVDVSPGLEERLGNAAQRGQVVEVRGRYRAVGSGDPELVPEAVEPDNP